MTPLSPTKLYIGYKFSCAYTQHETLLVLKDATGLKLTESLGIYPSIFFHLFYFGLYLQEILEECMTDERQRNKEALGAAAKVRLTLKELLNSSLKLLVMALLNIVLLFSGGVR